MYVSLVLFDFLTGMVAALLTSVKELLNNPGVNDVRVLQNNIDSCWFGDNDFYSSICIDRYLHITRLNKHEHYLSLLQYPG